MNKTHKKISKGQNKLQKRNNVIESQSNISLQAASNTLVTFLQGGDFQAAENLAKNIIAQIPDHAFSWKVLGVALKNLGKLEESLEAKRKATSLLPQDAEAHNNLGTTFQELGRLEEAERAYKEAIAIKTNYAEAHYNLGTTFHAVGRLEEAEDSYKKAIAIKPNYAEVYNHLGITLKQLGKLEESEFSYKKAIEINPNYSEAYNNLGITLNEFGRLEEAEHNYRLALAHNQNMSVTFNNLGITLQELGRLEEAEDCYKKAITINPNYAEAYSNLGTLFQEVGRLEGSEDCYKKSIAILPDSPGAHNNLGTILQALGRPEESEICYKKAIAIKSNYAEAYNNLGVTLQEIGRIKEAEANYQKAIDIKPNYAEAHGNLGAMYRLKGRYVDASESISRALAIDANYANALQEYSTLLAHMSNYKDVCKYSDAALEIVGLNSKDKQESKIWKSRLYTLIYHPDLSAKEICAEYIKWGSRYTQKAQDQFFGKDRNPDRKLKIGYVSPDFRSHSCRFYFEPLFSSHDQTKFELYAYANVSIEDEHTHRFKKYFSVWRDIVGIADESVAQMILNDEIDILVDGCGHMGDTRLEVFSYKPAPIQVTWLGAAWTTGLPQMDYVMFDPYMGPVGTPTSEKIVQLPNTWCSFRPGEKAINTEVKPTPAIQNGYVTFGYTGRTERLNHRVFTVWGRILKRLPNSRLLLDFKSFGDSKTQSYFAQILNEYGVDVTRVTMRNSENIFESLGDIDILLDSFPHNGGTMLYDAIWMGVPIVSLASTRPVGRIGASIMTNLGLPEWIAKSELEFEDIAVNGGQNIAKLAILRSQIRVRMKNSAIMNEKLFAQDVENAYRKMWGSWLASSNSINN